MATVLIVTLLAFLVTPWCNIHGITVTQERTMWSKPGIRISANLTSYSYKILIGIVRAAVTEIQGTKDLLSHPRLPQQLLSQPLPTWIAIELTGRGDQRTEIALRGDNLNLTGFKNNAGDWFEFKPDSQSVLVIPDATVLTFGGGYADLLGSWWRIHMGAYDMSKSTLLDAIETLNNHPSNYDSEEDLKGTLATVIVMIVEASRLNPIRNLIFNSWPMGARIVRTYVKYIATWTKMSQLVLCLMNGRPWTHPDAEELRNMGINTIEDVFGALHIVLWPVSLDPSNVEESCKRSSNSS